ncbi:MAG: flagellar biosynthesis protein FlhF [Firmicutes bacterium]|nr:flagellar biosynthesis protein FlhF [Bacillota bacterium]
MSLRVKTYCVDNVQEGLQQIKKELGPDAIILQSRKVRKKGLLGLFAPPMIEITAAVDGSDNSHAKQKDFATEMRWQNEIGKLKQMMQQMFMLQQKQTLVEQGPYFPYWQQLVMQGVEEKLAQTILAEIEKEFGDGEPVKDEVMKLLLQKKIEQKILTEKLPADARILAFTGPTGVGKTTTLAKLAAHFALYQKKKVGMITIDTFRIGAVEQLRTYADITGIPIEVAMTPKDITRAMERLADRDLILVDTAGRSANNSLQVMELSSFLAQLPRAEIFLVLSVTTKTSDLYLIVDKFRQTGYNRLIFTKLDETSSYGAILNAISATGMPVTYLTTGQNVPDDLEEADAVKMAELILKG